jgi:hypothetical protein
MAAASSVTDPVSELAQRCGRSWPTIFGARDKAQAVRTELEGRLTDATLPLIPADTSLIVFGSLARGEWTNKSDLDWTLSSMARSMDLTQMRRGRSVE